jgi:hypothetical protein
MSELSLRRTDPAAVGVDGGLPWSWMAPLAAVSLAFVAGLWGWKGVDLPAQLYRVGLFHRQGLTLWDTQWYGGHWTLGYSVVFPPLAGVIGLRATEIASAGVAALAFDRLAVGHFGRGARAGSVMFALGTLVPVAIGQLPFLLGEALALAACWATVRKRWPLAIPLALGASLASPLAGAFLVLGVGAWLLGTWPEHRVGACGVIAGATIPIVALTTLFPGQGAMPFPLRDFLAEGAIFAAAALFVPRDERTLRIGTGLYIAAFVANFVVPSALGGNIERLGETLGLPLAVCVLWPLRRAVLAALALPFILINWGPAWSAVMNPTSPSSNAQFFVPVVSYLDAHDNPLGRVEIVPTAAHWEAAYVAPSVPLARGWERQLDTADNPIFYLKGALTPQTYRSWLVENGVRFVALPDVQLDYAAVGEGRLVQEGVPGLRMVWHSANWRVYEVHGSPGIVSGPARAVALRGDTISLDVTAPGTIHLKERYSPRWALTQGAGCTHEDTGGWLSIQAKRSGPMRVQLRLFGPGGDAC